MTGLGASRRASRGGGVSQDSLVLVLSGYQVPTEVLQRPQRSEAPQAVTG